MIPLNAQGAGIAAGLRRGPDAFRHIGTADPGGAHADGGEGLGPA